MSRDPEPIAEFQCQIPMIQSAVKFGGDGMTRLQLDIYPDDMPDALKLAAYGREKVLRVAVYESTP